MARVGRWMWERHARHFMLTLASAVTLAVSLGLSGPCVVIGSLYLDLRWQEGLIWGAAIVVAVAVAMALMLASMRTEREAIRRWADGDVSDPTAAWLALVHLPQLFGRRTLQVILPVSMVVSFPVVVVLARPGVAGILGLLYAYLLVVIAAAVLLTSIVQLLVRPAATDVGARVDQVDAELTSRWTIRVRLVLATFVATSLAGVAVPLLLLGTGADERDYLVSLVGGGVLGAYVTWLLDIGIFQPTVAPMADVIAGTVRVRRGDLADRVPISSQDEIGDLAVAFNAMQVGLRQRASLQAAFGSYVDPLLATRLVESGSSVFEGEDLDVTVLFADVRDFTSYSERVTPADAVALLNRLFDVVVPVLHEHGGHANHYLGDGLLAVFGAPTPMADHADAGVAAAIEMQRRVRATFGDELRLGIGINTGPVIAGTVGGGGRHEFTVIGDTVNVAARVEQATKDTGDRILITDATRSALSPPRLRTTKRGAFDLKGKAAAVTLHAIPLPRGG